MTAAARQRRRRERVRSGKRVLPVEVDATLLEDALLCGGLLDAADVDDQQKISAALVEAIHAWCEEQLAAELVDEMRHA